MIQYTIPSSLDNDIFHFEKNLAEFRAERLHETSFTAKRVRMGVYLERNRTTYMCRIRCGANIITPKQLGALGELTRRYGNGKVHVTTRAEAQLHGIKEKDVIPVLLSLKDVGLSCKGGGGNTIRNIVTNHDSGISRNEVFDVQPCVLALTDRLIAEPDSWELPRKMKIAFCSRATETAFCYIQDVGFVARLNADGERGFRVYVGGGLGARPKAGVPLHEFIPEDEVYYVVKAVKNMFHLYGNRKNKHKNRIRFLLHEDLGAAAFLTYYRQELNKVVDCGYPKLDIEPIDNTENIRKEIDLAPEREDSDDFRTWKKRHVAMQKQEGLCRIKVPLFTGDLDAQDCRELENLLRPFGENTLRCSTDQNIYLINIPEIYLPNVYRTVMACNTLSNRPRLYGNLIACAGSQGCQVGITAPKPATKAVFEYLETVSAEDFCPPDDILIRISGCPNSCTNHWIGDLSFYGKVRRVEGHLIPTYNVLGNGGMHEETLRLAEVVGWVHAYDLPRFITEVMRRYAVFKENSEDSVDFNAYWTGVGKEAVEELCKSGYNDIPTFTDDKNYYFDHGAEQLFSLKDIGHAECSAGIYDMIDVDDKVVKKNIRRLEAWEEHEDDELNALLQNTLLHAARMLLVTRGEEPKTESEIYSLFVQHFLDSGLVGDSHRPLIDSACQGKTDSLCEYREQVVAFGRELTELYKKMDNTMRFPGEHENMVIKAVNKEVEQNTAPAEKIGKSDRFEDLSGVRCPLNYAKAKVLLSSMHSGETLELLLDNGPPSENVPRSVQQDGHTILHREKVGNQLSVLIRKA